MHCPLCKTQYRPGYDLCRDCDADLVSGQETDAEDVVLFWQSENPSHIAQLADALKEANVPNYSRFGAGTERALWAGSPLAGLFARERTASALGQIFVLAADLYKARRVAYTGRIQPVGQIGLTARAERNSQGARPGELEPCPTKPAL